MNLSFILTIVIAVKSKIFFSILIFSRIFFLPAQTHNGSQQDYIQLEKENLLELTSLKPHSTNILLKEFNSIVENNYKLIAAGKTPEYVFFRYKNSEGFTVYELSSRLNINYDTIITLNRISSKDDSISGKTLIIPTIQGIFIPEGKGKNSIEVLLQQNYRNQNLTNKKNYYKIEGEEFSFYQGKRLSPTERAFFLDSALRLPLDENSFIVSSEFGARKNPFSGQLKNHNGIDLAAEEGTPVYAIKDGSAAYVFEKDPEFGNYIILSHDQGKQTSVYAHLSKINVGQYDFVKKGTIIGYVGQTGMATASHLHFEIRQGGKAQNPREKLNF